MAQRERKRIDEESAKLLQEIEKVSEREEKDKPKKAKKEKKATKKVEKKAPVKKESWWHGVKSEFKKVRWPNKKEMLKYSIATISFIIFFGLFFFAIEGIIFLISTL